jgi:hypothetical protein
MVSSAAALHLNTITMQYMKDWHYFWHTWENRWLADININADRMVIKELVGGEFWSGKVTNQLRYIKFLNNLVISILTLINDGTKLENVNHLF